MPRKLTENTQGIRCSVGRLAPLSMASAGTGATSPPEMMLAAEEAAVCVMLPSPAS
jgi:hypothetical protein